MNATARHRRWRWFGAIATLVLVAMVAAACGDDDEDATSEAAPAAESTAAAESSAAPAESSASADSSAADVSSEDAPAESSAPTGGDAQSMVDAAAGPVQFIDPGGAIDISAIKGKKVWVVTADASLPFVIAVLDGMKEAGQAAGVDVQVFDGKGSATTEAAGIEQAIAGNAGAIVLFGINLKNVAGAVQSANDANIPVVGSLNIDLNDPIEDGAAGEVTIDYYKSGKLLSAFAVANTDEPVKAAYQNLPAIDTFAAMKRGVEDGLKEFCPEGCDLAVDDLTQANFKTAAETLTASQIARNPDLNWIFPFIDGIAGFTIPAIETAGKAEDIRVGSINAVSANLQYIVDGRVQAVDVGNNNSWLGWAMLDRALRAMTGQEPATSEVPVKLFNQTNLEGKDVENEDALFDDVDYRGGYTSLWQG